jgi:ABC-type nitrate/sulfonate/bicarbonate transport system permease component
MSSLAPWTSVLTLAIAWEAFARSGAVTPFMLPALSVVLERMWADGASGDLWANLGLTLYRSFAGFLIAAALGIPLGVLIVRNRAARWFFDPLISVGFPMPKIAFLPIVTLWLGFHDVSKITMVVLDAVFPVVTAAIAATAAGRRATSAPPSASCCARWCCRRRCRRSSPGCRSRCRSR